jgi:type 1 fimbria pilin
MSPFKLVCVSTALAASVAVSLGAGAAVAECSRSQEIALGQAATRAMADQGGTQHQKQITLHDCDASDDGSVNARFTYNYFDEQGLQTVTGTVKADNGRITSLDTGKRDRSVASRDDRDDYDNTNLGRYSYR